MRCCTRLHWMVGMSLLVGLWIRPAVAQESEDTSIVVSPRVGEVIDAEERVRFQLFPDIPGFQSAVFLRQPDGKVVARVRFLDKGVESVREFGISAALLSAIREMIDHAEERPAGPGPQHQQPLLQASGQGPLIPGAHVRLPRSLGLIPESRVRVTLRSGLTLSGRVLQMTDSTVVLSSAQVPRDLLQQQSLPLRVSDEAVVLYRADGRKIPGQIIQVTQRQVVLVVRRAGSPEYRATVERDEIVAVLSRGREAQEVQVRLRWEDIKPGVWEDIKPGVRVRLQAPTVAAQRLVGTVVSVDTATIILLTNPSPLTIPRAAVTRLELSQGWQWSGTRTAKGARIGPFVGGVVGILIATALFEQWHEEEGAGLVFLFLPPVGAVAGLVGGTLIGAWPREQWETVPLSRLRLGMTPLPPRGAATPGIGLVLSVSFP